MATLAGCPWAVRRGLATHQGNGTSRVRVQPRHADGAIPRKVVDPRVGKQPEAVAGVCSAEIQPQGDQTQWATCTRQPRAHSRLSWVLAIHTRRDPAGHLRTAGAAAEGGGRECVLPFQSGP